MKRLLCWSLVGLLATQSAAAIDLFVRNVRAGEAVFGPTEVAFEVLSAEPVAAIEIRLDGEEVARLDQPPFRTLIDFGDENRSRTLEVTVRDVRGNSVSRTIVTGEIEVQEELDLELQQLYVTVSRDGRRVLDLVEEDFAVIDGETRQQLVTFETGDLPLTAVLLIDSSHSMQGAALRAALAGAGAFVESMRPLDEAKVIVFSDRLLAATPFTGDPGAVRSVMDTVEASGGTAIHDHLFLALKELDGEPGRQVIVLLSDGIDGESVLDMADVEWKAGRMQSLIYWIRPAPDDSAGGYFSVWRDIETQRREIAALQRVVRASGGKVREIEHIEQASQAFREILEELREQYALGYYPSVNRNDGAWREVRVRVRPPGVQVRCRGGYYDDRL